ncbi:MAG: SprT family zinc-dependent metalloprotease [Candidatus Omnitrophota bacterium]
MEEELIQKIVRSKRRSLGLEITPEACLIIRAPMRISLEDIHRIIKKKMSWILKKKQRAKEKYRPVIKHQFVEGEEFLYLGQPYKLCVLPQAKARFQFDGEKFLLADAYQSHAKRLLTQWYAKQAVAFIPEKVKAFANLAGVSYSRITITSARTRWGSCTSQKSLNFSWRLMMAPQKMIDYVIVHEVCHLQELNHSRRFWKKVENLMPDYKQRQQWFRDQQYMLAV